MGGRAGSCAWPTVRYLVIPRSIWHVYSTPKQRLFSGLSFDKAAGTGSHSRVSDFEQYVCDREVLFQSRT